MSWTTDCVLEWDPEIPEELGCIVSDSILQGKSVQGTVNSRSRHRKYNIAGDEFLESARFRMDEMKHYQVYAKDHCVTLIDHGKCL